MPLGSHRLVLQAWDKAGGIYKKGINIDVLPIKVTIASPTDGATLSSPVHVKANVPTNSTAFSIQIYVDDALKYEVKAKSLDTFLPMGPGQHHIVAQAWDSGGGVSKNGIYVTVK
jgi:hypothetical protein